MAFKPIYLNVLIADSLILIYTIKEIRLNKNYMYKVSGMFQKTVSYSPFFIQLERKFGQTRLKESEKKLVIGEIIYSRVN